VTWDQTQNASIEAVTAFPTSANSARPRIFHNASNDLVPVHQVLFPGLPLKESIQRLRVVGSRGISQTSWLVLPRSDIPLSESTQDQERNIRKPTPGVTLLDTLLRRTLQY